MPTAVIVFFGLIGLAMGSFATVLIERLPSGQSIGGRSRCPRCHKQLQWVELVPVVSFLVLGGRCRHCRKTITLRYPFIELMSMALFVGSAMFHAADTTAAITTGIILWALLVVSVIDALHRQIPDLLTAIVAAAAVVAAIDAGSILSGAAGALLCLLWFGGQWLLSRGRWVGAGDILLGAALGFWLGGISAVGMLLLAYIIGMVWIVILLAQKRVRLDGRSIIAFGPFLALAAVATHIGAVDWYLRMIF